MANDEFDLDRAFSVRTPAQNRDLYAGWAATYDDDLLARRGYVQHRSVVETYLRRSRPSGGILDVGCGTGIVGLELRRRGVAPVDGVDLSPEMLEIAAAKQTSEGDAVYRDLIAADLTGSLGIPDASYAGVVSAGAFTHGHLGPEPLAELLRVARHGSTFAIGVNSEHYESAGFATWLDEAQAAGRIHDLEIVSLPVYDLDRYEAGDADEHAATRSSVALFHRT